MNKNSNKILFITGGIILGILIIFGSSYVFWVLNTPRNLVSEEGNASITIKWNIPFSIGLSKYEIYRSDSEDQSPSKLIEAEVKDNSYIDTTAVESQKYYYMIKAINKFGWKSKSVLIPGVWLKPQALARPKVKIEGDSIILDWGGSSDVNLNGYNIYRSDDSNYIKINQEIVKENHYKDLNINPQKKYYYKITAVDKNGNEGSFSVETPSILMESVSLPKNLQPPINLEAYPGYNYVNLEWSKIASNMNMAGYNIYRVDKYDATPKKITPSPIENSFYKDTTAQNGDYSIFYTYSLKAVDRTGAESEASNAVSAFPPSPTVYARVKADNQNDIFSASVIVGQKFTLSIEGYSDIGLTDVWWVMKDKRDFNVISNKIMGSIDNQTAELQNAFGFGKCALLRKCSYSSVVGINKPGSYEITVRARHNLNSKDYDYDVRPPITIMVH